MASWSDAFKDYEDYYQGEWNKYKTPIDYGSQSYEPTEVYTENPNFGNYDMENEGEFDETEDFGDNIPDYRNYFSYIPVNLIIKKARKLRRKYIRSRRKRNEQRKKHTRKRRKSHSRKSSSRLSVKK